MELFNLKIKNTTLGLLCAFAVLFIGCLMSVSPFVHIFDIASFWGAFGAVMAVSLVVMIVAFSVIIVTFISLRSYAKINFSQYIFSCSILLGLLGSIWGGVVYIMGFLPYLAMFVGVVILLINCACYIWLHHKRFLPYYGDNVVNCFRRHQYIMYSCVIICLILWILL